MCCVADTPFDETHAGTVLPKTADVLVVSAPRRLPFPTTYTCARANVVLYSYFLPLFCWLATTLNFSTRHSTPTPTPRIYTAKRLEPI